MHGMGQLIVTRELCVRMYLGQRWCSKGKVEKVMSSDMTSSQQVCRAL